MISFGRLAVELFFFESVENVKAFDDAADGGEFSVEMRRRGER